MSRPGPPDDHSVRSLAEILREHGLESEFGTRPGRRRQGDSRADWPARPAPEDQPPSRLRPDAGTGARPARPRAPQPPPSRQPRPDGRAAAETQAAAAKILREHGLETEYGTRPGRRTGGSKADWPALPAPEDQRPSRLRPPADPGSGARVARPRDVPRDEVRPRSGTPAAAVAAPSPPPPSAGAVPAQAPAGVPRATRTPAAPVPPVVPPRRPSSRSGAPRPADTDDPVATGTFAAVVAGATADDADVTVEEPPTAGQSAVAWARFAGELLLAVAVGVGTYFAFTVLWELMPYVAMVAAPLVLTALVAGVAAWRHRREQAQLGVQLLAVLVFAGTLLVIAPAAGLLAGR